MSHLKYVTRLDVVTGHIIEGVDVVDWLLVMILMICVRLVRTGLRWIVARTGHVSAQRRVTTTRT